MPVVDTNGVVKWTVMEAGSEDAAALLRHALIAPDRAFLTKVRGTRLAPLILQLGEEVLGV